MKIVNEFTVSVPVERAWEVLTDLEGIAPCMPGAMLTGVEGDTYSGKLKLKVGPVVSDFAGTASFVTKDDAEHKAVIDAKGREARGSGNASASISAALRPDGADRTVVSVETDLKISGKLAQFGSRMIGQVSEKLLAQFVTCLESKLAADPARTESPASDAATAEATPPPPAASDSAETAVDAEASEAPAAATAATAAATEAAPPAGSAQAPASAERLRAVQEEPEPVDLVKLAGGTVAKRLVPLVVGVVVVVVVVWYLAAR